MSSKRVILSSSDEESYKLYLTSPQGLRASLFGKSYDDDDYYYDDDDERTEQYAGYTQSDYWTLTSL